MKKRLIEIENVDKLYLTTEELIFDRYELEKRGFVVSEIRYASDGIKVRYSKTTSN